MLPYPQTLLTSHPAFPTKIPDTHLPDSLAIEGNVQLEQNVLVTLRSTSGFFCLEVFSCWSAREGVDS